MGEYEAKHRARMNRRVEVAEELKTLLAEFDELCVPSSRIRIVPVISGVLLMTNRTSKSLTQFGVQLVHLVSEDTITAIEQAKALHPSNQDNHGVFR